jgi:hexosaminidase
MDSRNFLFPFLNWLRAFRKKTLTMWVTLGLRKQPSCRPTPSNKVSVYAQHCRRQSLCRGFLLFTCSMLFTAAALLSETSSPLASRGYSVLPVPQKVTLTGEDFALDGRWKLELGGAVKEDDIAVESLKASLASRFHLSLAESGSGRLGSGVIQMDLRPKSVFIGQAIYGNKPALVEQAYRLTLGPRSLKVTANAPPGLFYGVQTLIQLIRPRDGRLWLPEGEIVDWPDVELRVIYWDDAHHLEHLEVLKGAVREAAFFKINGFAIKLEGHFQYKSVRAIVEPYALARSELQELTDFALRLHVQLIPYLDAPGHVAFILKHPEYAALRAFPNSNYEFCVTNPETYKLLFGMYDDLLEATKGGKYFVLSTDEPYYVGLAHNSQCEEETQAHTLGSVGKLLAEFVTKAANYLHDRGRTVLFWGEYPLQPEDISALPSHLVNGEVYGPEFDSAYKKHGIRQLVYTSTQGEEPLFPQYYMLPSTRRVHVKSPDNGRVTDMFNLISFTPARQNADLMGVFVAGWADAGLHPETFWLGYATGPATAWHPASASPAELMNSFYDLFYGAGAQNMGRLYQLMSEQAQIWDDTWEISPSSVRTPIWGNSDKIFDPPKPANDQTLPPLPVPSAANLTISGDWTRENSRRLEIAAAALQENDELLDLLYANFKTVNRHRYNLKVFVSVADLCRQNLEMILELGRMNEMLKTAQTAAKQGKDREAVASLDEALNTAAGIQGRRNRALQNATSTWYQTWFARVAEANGRHYLNQADDVKDHRPARTIDMSYLVYRELLYPLGDWAAGTLAARNEYARAHQLPERTGQLNWKDTEVPAN